MASPLEFLWRYQHLAAGVALPCAGFWKLPEMSTFYSHRDRFCDPAGEGRAPAASLTQMAVRRLRMLARRAVRRAGAAFGIIHQGIVTAKTRRLQRELLFHGDAHDYDPLEQHPQEDVHGPDRDAAKFAQRPLVLGDKWDF
jgi:hypothetical protein